MIYLMGSLRNPMVPVVANTMRDAGLDVFDDWFAAGPEADDCWQRYEQGRGRTMQEALRATHAKHVYAFDLEWLHACDTAVLLLPAGKSAHLELGWMLGRKQPGYVLYLEEPARMDVMYQFATGVFTSLDDLIKELTK